MSVPSAVREVIQTAVDEHGVTEETVRCALSRVRAMPDFADHVKALIEQSIENLVYKLRNELLRGSRPSKEREEREED